MTLFKTVRCDQLGYVITKIKLLPRDVLTFTAHVLPKRRIVQQGQNLVRHCLSVTTIYQVSGFVILEQLGYSSHTRGYHRFAVSHRFDDGPSKHFFPTRELADYIGRFENAFTERILHHPGPGHTIFNPHFNCSAHTLLAITPIANNDKLNIPILATHDTGSLEKIYDSLLRNYPAHLGHNRPI